MRANVAVTDRARDIFTWHSPVPEHAPDQPVNLDPAAALGVNVTTVRSTNDAVHRDPHLIPAGLEVTDPDPVPARLTESWYMGVHV